MSKATKPNLLESRLATLGAQSNMLTGKVRNWKLGIKPFNKVSIRNGKCFKPYKFSRLVLEPSKHVQI